MLANSVSDHILLQMLNKKFDEITTLIDQLPEDLVNTAPSLPGANSPVQILVHCCGMMRRWSSSVNLGVPVTRDREGEFTAIMAKAEALSLAANTHQAFAKDLAKTNLHSSPAAIPPGWEHEIWLATCLGVLLHVYEEFCQHLGQLEITRDVLVFEQRAPGNQLGR